MQATLDIADDVLQAVRDLARRRQTTADEIANELIRKGLVEAGVVPGADPRLAALGVRPLPRRGVVVTNDLVNRLREADGV